MGNRPFWRKIERFDREINIEHKQVPKYILTEDVIYHATQHNKRVFWYLAAVLISNS